MLNLVTQVADKFTSISSLSEGLFKDRGSRFIAYAWPVSAEEEVAPLLKALEAEHHSARHICYAYRIPKPVQTADGSWSVESLWRANDNGEPSGTAGRPILGQIDSAGLSGVLVAVVRYFGGVLLGVPGLINAYRSAAADALDKAERTEKTLSERIAFRFPYSDQPEAEKLLKLPGVTVASREFAEDCLFTVDVALDAAPAIKDLLSAKKWLTLKEKQNTDTINNA